MTKIKLFESKQIRSVWNEADSKWYFAVVDVVEVLTDSSNPTDYLKKLRKRDPELAKGWGQIVTPLLIETALFVTRNLARPFFREVMVHFQRFKKDNPDFVKVSMDGPPHS